MSKHPLDHQPPASGTRFARFAQLERAMKPREVTKALQRRVRHAADTRLPRYLRIQRSGSLQAH